MARIFGSLAVFSVTLMAAAALLGLPLDTNENLQRVRQIKAQVEQRAAGATADGDVEALPALRAELERLQNEMKRRRGRAGLHLLVGIAAALCAVLVSSVAVTYFIGTSRWCREVCEAYELSPELIQRSQRLKRRAFPWAFAVVVVVMAVAALGAASDPGTLRGNTSGYVTPHFLAAMGGVTLMMYAFFVVWGYIAENHRLIDEVLTQVQKIRTERGLSV